MERRYRGYPQGITPYGLYNRESQQIWPGDKDEKRRMQTEYDYVRGLYPMDVRRWQRFVEEELDRNDGPNSSLYDEYPDREWIYRVRNQIMKQAGEQRSAQNPDLVLILMLHEMMRRRQRRRLG